jgi:hypothetical protein
VQLATVSAERLGDFERGLDEVEQALNDDSQHEGAVQLLERLKGRIEDVAIKGRLAGLLEPVYMVRADYDKVLGALQMRLEGSDVPDERRDLVTRMAQIHEEQKEDYAAALEITATLLHDDPSDILTVEEMERLAKVAGAELLFGTSEFTHGCPRGRLPPCEHQFIGWRARPDRLGLERARHSGTRGLAP